MTFSIVAVDKKNGEIGFAGASCIYNAGRIGFVQAELGAIATQSLVNFSLGPLFLEKLQEGLSLEAIMEHFREVDEGIELRQIGMATYAGDVLSFTGNKCLEWAGHREGKNYCCQGNILVGPEIIENMGKAFENASGPLSSKLFAALQAADNSGGDARGKQSARIIVEKKGAGFLDGDRLIDINVEDHDEPVQELGRILSVFQFYQHINAIYAKYEDNPDKAINEMEKYMLGREERHEKDGWAMLGYMYYQKNKKDKAIKHYKHALKIAPKFKNILDKYPQLGRLDQDFVDKILQ